MAREEVYEKLTGIFRDVFNDDALLISDRTTAADIEDPCINKTILFKFF